MYFISQSHLLKVMSTQMIYLIKKSGKILEILLRIGVFKMERTCKKIKSCVIPGRHTLAKLCIRIPLIILGHFNTINKTDFSDNYMSYTSNVGKFD